MPEYLLEILILIFFPTHPRHGSRFSLIVMMFTRFHTEHLYSLNQTRQKYNKQAKQIKESLTGKVPVRGCRVRVTQDGGKPSNRWSVIPWTKLMGDQGKAAFQQNHHV